MQAYAAYSQTQNVTENARSVEYRLLSQVTAELMQASEAGSSIQRRAEALKWNRQVWAAFVDRETVEVLYERTDFANLIEVNRNVMKGLVPVEA